MAQPIAICDARLTQYLQLFHGLFSQSQWKYFVTVLLGLLHCDERRTLAALLRQVAVGITIFGLCHFLRGAPWPSDALLEVRQVYFYQQMAPLVAAAHAEQRAQRLRRPGRPKPTVVTGYLILDDSTHAKQYAQAQAGLGHHYSGVEKGIVKGHSLFLGVYVLLGRQLPLQPQLYRQRCVCAAEGVPFTSKIALACNVVTAFAPPADTHTHLLIDSWYMAKTVWRAARQREWDVTGGLKANRMLRLSAPDGARRWLAVGQYAAELKRSDFTQVAWPTQDGSKPMYVHMLRTRIRKLGPCQVLIVKPGRDAPPEQWRYWATSRLQDTLEQVVGHVAQRWTIEVLFADYKELLGSDHYQLRTAQGLVRFWALGLCLYQFLDEIRAAHRRQTGQHLTLGQARQQIRQANQDLLLDWIVEQVQAGAPREQIRQALQPAMLL